MLKLLLKLKRSSQDWSLLEFIKKPDKIWHKSINIKNMKNSLPQLTNYAQLRPIPKIIPYRKLIRSFLKDIRLMWNTVREIVLFGWKNEQKSISDRLKETMITKSKIGESNLYERCHRKIVPDQLKRPPEIEQKNTAPTLRKDIFAGAQNLREGRLLPENADMADVTLNAPE
jgi:hypothetical protein